MRPSNGMSIGRLAAATRCTVPTIRYYEQIGLLPKAARRLGGHRLYGEADRQRLTFIRRCRDFGFPIEQVRRLAALVDGPEQDCVAARDIAQVNLIEVRRKLKELRALERSLKGFVATCDAQCAGGPAGDCVIIEELAGPTADACCGGAAASSPARGPRVRRT